MFQLKYLRNARLDHRQIEANQIAAARVLVGITQLRLADLAGISNSTVKRIESGLPVTKANRSAIIHALEKAGVEFTNDDQPGVRMKR
jgi:transcriptional regulator with XRE-family HTH domain